MRVTSSAFYLYSILGLLLSIPSYGAVSVDDAISRDTPRHPTHPASVVELAIPSHGEKLPGHIYLADGPGPHPTVVLLHGFPGNEKNLDLAQALRRFGFNTLFFHYRGAWGGTGRFRFGQLPEDAGAVVRYLRSDEQRARLRVDPAAISVLGHSLGGYTALATGAREDSLRCVMALSPANLGLWKGGLGNTDNPNTQRLLAYADTLFMLRGLSGDSFREELDATPMAALDTTGFGSGLLGKSVLMMVGEDDQVTPAASMFDPVVAAYEAVDGLDLTARKISGDHSFSWSRVQLTRDVLTWADGHCR